MRKKPKGNSDARVALLATKAQIEVMPGRIAMPSPDHFGADLARVNGGDDGTHQDYARRIRQIADCAVQECEHAE